MNGDVGDGDGAAVPVVVIAFTATRLLRTVLLLLLVENLRVRPFARSFIATSMIIMQTLKSKSFCAQQK